MQDVSAKENELNPLPWLHRQWRPEVEDWVQTELGRYGAEITGEMTLVKDSLWSRVMCAPTTKGVIYFKAVGPLLRFEAGLSDYLFRRFPEDCIPVIAHDRNHGWLLMPDAGIRLRETHGFEITDWYTLLSRYASVQIQLMPNTDALLETEMPDRRAAALPAIYEDLVEQAFHAYAHTDYRLTVEERDRFRAFVSVLNGECRELVGSGIPDSIDHGDLHDGNVFVKNDIARFADWGDSCVAHPFVSVLVPFNVFAARFNFAPDAPEIARLRDAYLEPFEIFADRETLRRTFVTARHIGEVFRAFSWHNAISLLPENARTEHAESALYWLRKYNGVE